MPSKPRTNSPTPAPGEPVNVASPQHTEGPAEPSPPMLVDPPVDDVMARLTALQLDAYAQALRAISAPTELDAAAGDEVSALVAVRFGGYGAVLEKIGAQFAAAHAALMKSLTTNGNSGSAADAGDATATT
ncbi:PE family protein [Mycobacterium marinum]|uniref:PE family protein n=1 Tax=Mycobacterium marinum TaxID=1781 RepID=UPI00356AC5B5